MRPAASRTASAAPPLWTSLAPPSAALGFVVVIPVRSEAARLAGTLSALAEQVGDDGRPLPPGCFEIIVLANNCTDASADVVRGFARDYPHLNVHVAEVAFPAPLAHVGHARACLMDEACRRLHSIGRDDGIIASTDGDTRVARDWLSAIAQEMRHGADAVGGRIDMDDDSPLPDAVTRLTRRDADYQQLRNRLEHELDPNPADPWPRHHQHFGANLAITVNAYLRVGGLPAKPFLEDEALCQALLARDMKLRHSDKVRVVTSNRRRGRVAVGLSWQLREWSALAESAADADARVDDPTRLAQDLALRRSLRDLWTTCSVAANSPASAFDSARPRMAVLAAALDVPVDWLHRRVHSSTTFGRLWLAVAARRRSRVGAGAEARMPMREAIALLRSMLAPIEATRERLNDEDDERADAANTGTSAAASAATSASATDKAVVSGARRGPAGSVLGASRQSG